MQCSQCGKESDRARPLDWQYAIEVGQPVHVVCVDCLGGAAPKIRERLDAEEFREVMREVRRSGVAYACDECFITDTWQPVLAVMQPQTSMDATPREILTAWIEKLCAMPNMVYDTISEHSGYQDLRGIVQCRGHYDEPLLVYVTHAKQGDGDIWTYCTIRQLFADVANQGIFSLRAGKWIQVSEDFRDLYHDILMYAEPDCGRTLLDGVEI